MQSKSRKSGDEQLNLLFNQNASPRVIFGTGNINGGYTVGTGNNIEVALRGKLRFDVVTGCQPANTFNSNGDGTYSFKAGDCSGNGKGIWSFEYSINSDVGCDSVNLGSTCTPLSAYDYELQLDGDRSYNAVFDWTYPSVPGGTHDLVNVPAHDHSLGTDSTQQGPNCQDSLGFWTCPSYASGCNVSPLVVPGQTPGCLRNLLTSAINYPDAINKFTVAQNSQQWRWLVPPTFYDYTKSGIYSVKLVAKCKGSDQILAATEITILVGDSTQFPTSTADCSTNSGWLDLKWNGLFRSKDDCLKFVAKDFP